MKADKNVFPYKLYKSNGKETVNQLNNIPCTVCGKVVLLTQSEAKYTTLRLCDECIKAIKFAKALMKNNPNMNVDGDDGK